MDLFAQIVQSALISFRQASQFFFHKKLHSNEFIFTGGGKALADLVGVKLLGTIPIDPRVGLLAGTGKACVTELPDCSTSTVLKQVATSLTQS